MSVTIDKTRLDMKESRKRFDLELEESRKRFDRDMEESRRRWEKGLHDMEMDRQKLALEQKRFNQQWWTVVVAAIGAGAAYLTWWTHMHP
jgi:hypothetical protein